MEERRTTHRDVPGMAEQGAQVCTTTRSPLPLISAPATSTSACASQHPTTVHKPTVRRQTPTPVCVVERDVRQPLVFIAPPLPARAQVVIFARAWMGPHSTPSIALAGQQHVILSTACSATHPTVNVHL